MMTHSSRSPRSGDVEAIIAKDNHVALRIIAQHSRKPFKSEYVDAALDHNAYQCFPLVLHHLGRFRGPVHHVEHAITNNYYQIFASMVANNNYIIPYNQFKEWAHLASNRQYAECFQVCIRQLVDLDIDMLASRLIKLSNVDMFSILMESSCGTALKKHHMVTAITCRVKKIIKLLARDANTHKPDTLFNIAHFSCSLAIKLMKGGMSWSPDAAMVGMDDHHTWELYNWAAQHIPQSLQSRHRDKLRQLWASVVAPMIGTPRPIAVMVWQYVL